ncbi:MAG: B12-binding domain-containing radical SAM protein [Candidatus Hermodarchaeota archaeon]
MRILYVNPSRLESGLDYIIKGPPLSLISIAAMVPEHEAKLFDFKVHKYREKAFIRELNRSDIVAISCMTPQVSHALEVAEMAKNQGCKTIIGGYHPTLDPEYVTKCSGVDFTVRGEGEHTFRELIDHIDEKKNSKELKQIDGISYKDRNGDIVHNRDRQLESNLDNFPLPRRDLLDDKRYIYLGVRLSQLESSRGCPHSCKFCCITKMWKDPTQKIVYRSKSVKRIMQEIYDVDRKNDFIFFCEDNFTIQVQRTKKILDSIIKSGIPNNFYFSCQSRVDTLYRNPWLIDLMHKAGMRMVFLGIESVHQQSLDAMNKRNLTPAKTRKVVSMLQDRGISIFGGIIIGFPGETKTMVRQTIQFAKSLKMTCVQFTPITAFPGTDFYEEMNEKGMITSRNYKHYNLFHTMMRTDQLTNKEIYRLVSEAYAAYYLSGGYLKMMAKRYCNPLGNFNWMGRNIPRFTKTVIRSGLKMLHTQGITSSVISDELKSIINQENVEKPIPKRENIDLNLLYKKQIPEVAN